MNKPHWWIDTILLWMWTGLYPIDFSGHVNTVIGLAGFFLLLTRWRFERRIPMITLERVSNNGLFKESIKISGDMPRSVIDGFLTEGWVET